MAKITIKDLPRDVKVTPEEMRHVLGGTTFRTNQDTRSTIMTIYMGWPPSNAASEGGTRGYTTSDDDFVLVF